MLLLRIILRCNILGARQLEVVTQLVPRERVDFICKGLVIMVKTASLLTMDSLGLELAM